MDYSQICRKDRALPQNLEAERAVLGACKYGFFRQEPKPGK